MRPAIFGLIVLLAGCATREQHIAVQPVRQSVGREIPRSAASPERPADERITRASLVEEVPEIEDPVAPPAPDDEPPMGRTESERLDLEAVIESVYTSYPLLHAAFYERAIASGNQLAATGNFDLKLKAATENGPLGFYQTYRQNIGLVQPTYGGGEAFAGYRIGRGDFQPWYLERQTNEGGEFKVGVTVPLARNQSIDDRRADLWRSTYGVQLAEPEIQAQLIAFVQEASYAYWEWIAAGRDYRIAKRILELATDRTDRIREQVQAGLLDPPELTDNLRLVAERRGKLALFEQKLQTKAVKLSLYLRDAAGDPRIPRAESWNDFPEPGAVDPTKVDGDSQLALSMRPELKAIDLVRRQYEVDYAQARNDLRPNVDGLLWGSQDVGAPTSSKKDKSPFEMEASVFVDVPLQRRKGLGKAQVVEGKLAQLSAKRRLVEDKIVASVQTAYVSLVSAHEQVVQAREAVRLAEELAARERRSFELGASDLLKVTLREQYAAESAFKEVESLLSYFQALADYRAAVAQDQVR